MLAEVGKSFLLVGTHRSRRHLCLFVHLELTKDVLLLVGRSHSEDTLGDLARHCDLILHGSYLDEFSEELD